MRQAKPSSTIFLGLGLVTLVASAAFAQGDVFDSSAASEPAAPKEPAKPAAEPSAGTSAASAPSSDQSGEQKTEPAAPRQAAKPSGSVVSHVNRGNSLMAARQYQAAMAEYNAAQALDPGNAVIKRNIAECFNNMGIMLFNKRMYADAIGRFDQCLKVNPQHRNAQRNKMLCHQRMEMEGNYEMAQEPDIPMETKKEPEKAPPADSSGNAVVADGSSGAVSLSAGGKMYISGSQLFPTYSNQASAVTTRITATVPRAPQSSPTPSSSNKQSGSSSSQAAQNASPSGIASASSGGSGSGGAADSGASSSSASALNQTTAANKSIWPPAAGEAFNRSASSELNTQANPGAQSSSNISPAAVPIVAEPPVSSSEGQAAGKPANPGAGGSKEVIAQNPVQVDSYAQPPATTPSAANTAAGTASADGLNLEQKVAALELKLYGKKNSDTPLMKRIEQLEMEHFGQIKSGTSFDRVENLRKAIGH